MRKLTLVGNILTFNGKQYRVAIGKGGFSADKKEGDGCTPVGTFYLRELYIRADKLKKPQTQLPVRTITQVDGWCDDPALPEYNKHVKLPIKGRFERLWLEDDTYDLIIPVGYNDAPVVPGKGSAIFIHVAKPTFPPTEGCIALPKADLLAIVSYLSPSSTIDIKPA